MVKDSKVKRARADSVLEGRMDGMQDFKKLRCSDNRNWQKMKAIIAKDTTKLCLIQVPKNVSVNSNHLTVCWVYSSRWRLS